MAGLKAEGEHVPHIGGDLNRLEDGYGRRCPERGEFILAPESVVFGEAQALEATLDREAHELHGIEAAAG